MERSQQAIARDSQPVCCSHRAQGRYGNKCIIVLDLHIAKLSDVVQASESTEGNVTLNLQSLQGLSGAKVFNGLKGLIPAELDLS
mmetsp:Transcript_71510/g.167502  ORF Transcript_71510/g.167502 Transcript_71510/m.167502 type:complete len:85 (+) Transcript_71510:29-283(+)